MPYDYTVEVTKKIQEIRSDRQIAWKTMDGDLKHHTGAGEKKPSPRKRNTKRQNGCLRTPYK